MTVYHYNRLNKCFNHSKNTHWLLIQNKCLRLISGALRCTRIERLEEESLIKILSIRREKLTVNQASNILKTENHTCKECLPTAKI